MAQTNCGILGDLKKFLAGVSVSGFQGLPKNRAEIDNVEIVKTATLLLKQLPASREAVLYYFCQVIDDSIKQHLSHITSNDVSASKKWAAERDIIPIIQESLSSLILWNPKGWAPIISTWSLRLLGRMSSYHSPQLRMNRLDNGLNDTLQVWLSCPPTRMLINLTTQCLEDLTPSETGACINALLETSVDHTPHFDWVVAHIGGCFPHTVVNRVLLCGLQDFVMYGADSANVSPKLQSVVGILAHLSFSHIVNVQKAVADLLQWSCTDSTDQHTAVVPYLLQLSSLSSHLLDIAAEQAVKCINEDTIPAFRKQSLVWKSKYFNSEEALMNLMVQQVIRCRQGGLELLKILTKYGTQQQESPHQVACEFLEMLLNEAAQKVQASGRVSPAEIPFLQSLQSDTSALCHLLSTSDSWQQGAVLRLLTLMAVLQGSSVSNHVVTLLLQKKQPAQIIPMIRSYVESVQGLHVQVVDKSVHEVLNLHGQSLENALLNLIQLVQLEMSEPDSNLKCKFQAALKSNLDLFPGLFFQDGKIPYLSVKLFNIIRLPEFIHPRLVAKLAYSVVPYYFTVLSLHGHGKKEAQKTLSTLSSYPNGQALILRLLMQGVFSQEWKPLFGAVNEPPRFRRNTHESSSLLTQNRNFCSSVTLPQRHSSVFHAGIIGNGIRNRFPDTKSDCNQQISEDVHANINFLLDTLSKCCSFNPAGMTQLSLLLVEIVSPDVMFNGLPWPDWPEEFTKVTVERDLHVRRFVKEHVVVWDLLNLLAQHRPSLCYCSVILRALLATLLSHWANCQEKYAKDSPASLEMTSSLIELMATGQLLPPPLSYLSEIIGHISPHEVHVLLKDVWAFMRDNVPAPSLFVTDRPNVIRDLSDYKMDPRYTERLRLIMLANISRVGHLYPRFLAPREN